MPGKKKCEALWTAAHGRVGQSCNRIAGHKSKSQRDVCWVHYHADRNLERPWPVQYQEKDTACSPD